LSWYLDSLFAYSLYRCVEMLSSGRSIFRGSSRGQVEDVNVLMQLSIGLYFTLFISIAILRLGLNGSVDSDAVPKLLFHCRKIETMSKSSGAVHFVSRLLWIRSNNCIPVVVDLYIVSSIWLIAVASGGWISAGLAFPLCLEYAHILLQC
jgi:hypothetical protein